MNTLLDAQYELECSLSTLRDTIEATEKFLEMMEGEYHDDVRIYGIKALLRHACEQADMTRSAYESLGGLLHAHQKEISLLFEESRESK